PDHREGGERYEERNDGDRQRPGKGRQRGLNLEQAGAHDDHRKEGGDEGKAGDAARPDGELGGRLGVDEAACNHGFSHASAQMALSAAHSPASSSGLTGPGGPAIASMAATRSRVSGWSVRIFGPGWVVPAMRSRMVPSARGSPPIFFISSTP